MTNRLTGDDHLPEHEPKLGIGDIIVLFSEPGQRHLVTDGTVFEGHFLATRLYHGDTRADFVHGSVKIADVAEVVGHMTFAETTDVLIATAIDTIGNNPDFKDTLLKIMCERLEKEQQNQP
jgi:hypothetical protein